MRREWGTRIVLGVLPAVLLAPRVLVPMPKWFYFDREIAGYFQALAYWRDPIGQFLYNTPAESLSSIHLHSLLSAPLVGLGFVQGGRVVSLGAAIVASLLVASVGTRLVSHRAGMFAAAVLWIHPLFRYLSTGYMPETLSIALTTASVAAMLLAAETGRRQWFGLALGAFLAAITVHLWEATILLPLVVIAAYSGQWVRARVFVYVGLLGVLVVYVATGVQPVDGGGLVRYALWNDFSVLLSLDRLWLRWARGLTPLSISLVATFPLAIGGCLLTGIQWLRKPSFETAVLGSWLASGLAIPILLANGYQIHQYYTWAVLAPLAIGSGWVLSATVARIEPSIAGDGRQWLDTPVAGTDGEGQAARAGRATAVVTVLLAAVLVVSVLGFQYGLVSEPAKPQRVEWGSDGSIASGEFVSAGQTIARTDAEAADLAFTGTWGFPWSTHFGQYPRLGQVLIYSDVLPRTRSPNPAGVAVHDTAATATNCEYVVTRDDRGTWVEPCRQRLEGLVGLGVRTQITTRQGEKQ
ncbi:glycosyltransferase family 39 protein [Halorhabdus rudnickae]|uniref:glycosyltransferase family 39 protein n=1 Tax=Halorhabdus rudnickae TaxID=1775544 RepID=UPI0010837A8B|nr:glycosyltransferase family 39 protein [Halorhabdus rudnickae]